MARGLSLIPETPYDRDVANVALDMARRGWIPRTNAAIQAVMDELQHEVGIKLGHYHVAAQRQEKKP